MKIKDTDAKFVNTLYIDKKKELSGIASIFQLMDLVADEQSYLEMLQTNGLKATEGKRGIGDESSTY
jgi:hypothetical protein